MADSKELSVDILPDGRIKVTTDTIDKSVHVTADAMIKWFATMTGAQPQVVKRNKKHAAGHHTHKHEH